MCFFDAGDAHAGGLSPAQGELIADAGVVCLTVAPAAATAAALERVAPESRVVWSVKADPDAYPAELVARLLERADVVAHSTGAREWLTQRAASRAPRSDALMLETRGARGLLWRRGTEAGEVEARRLAVTDTTGAGDAFVAGVIAELVQSGPDPARAAATGNAASRAFLEARLVRKVADEIAAAMSAGDHPHLMATYANWDATVCARPRVWVSRRGDGAALAALALDQMRAPESRSAARLLRTTSERPDSLVAGFRIARAERQSA